MASSRADLGLIVAQFAVLLGIVAFVDQVWLRLGMTFAVALLLVQRASGAAAAGGGGPSGEDRRQDPSTRAAIARLLELIREFYAAGHLAASSQISPAEATARAQLIEKQLNLLLAEVERASAGEAGRDKGAQPGPL